MVYCLNICPDFNALTQNTFQNTSAIRYNLCTRAGSSWGTGARGTSSPDSLPPDRFALRRSRAWLKGESARKLSYNLRAGRNINIFSLGRVKNILMKRTVQFSLYHDLISLLNLLVLSTFSFALRFTVHCVTYFFALPSSPALQLVDYPYGNGMEVVFAGGRKELMHQKQTDPEYPDKKGDRGDGRDLIQEWLDKRPNSHYVWNKTAFDEIDVNKVDRVIGTSILMSKLLLLGRF